MVDQWIKDVKAQCNPESLGMILVHNGVVRATSRDGKTVKGMRLSYDSKGLSECINEAKKREGIVDIKVWINEGTLRIGDDIMYVLVAGRFRTDVLPVFQELLSKIKKDIVREGEIVT
ncbi:MAG TPA: molybdenum cofactor biosynthesis protein MoaE [Syntrophorhabdaceae bacterium]|nr:molybdenum cofactor biosynthesis protein MoaE [Syntrophorhabdaceae bacterium]